MANNQDQGDQDFQNHGGNASADAPGRGDDR